MWGAGLDKRFVGAQLLGREKTKDMNGVRLAAYEWNSAEIRSKMQKGSGSSDSETKTGAGTPSKNTPWPLFL